MTQNVDLQDNPLFADKDFVAVPAEDLFKEDQPEPEKPEVPAVEEKVLSDEDKQEYLAIVDAVMFEGSYSEVKKFGKYTATFRSRTAGEDNEITKRLDALTFNTMMSYQNQSSLLTMAYSLIDLNGTDLKDMSLKDRYDYVAKLSSPLVILLSGYMADFDNKVMAAMEYGKANF